MLGYGIEVMPMVNEDKLESYILNSSVYGLSIGIVFNGMNESNCKTVPDFFHLELRQVGIKDASSLYPPTDKAGPYPIKGDFL